MRLKSFKIENFLFLNETLIIQLSRFMVMAQVIKELLMILFMSKVLFIAFMFQ